MKIFTAEVLAAELRALLQQHDRGQIRCAFPRRAVSRVWSAYLREANAEGWDLDIAVQQVTGNAPPQTAEVS